MVFVHDTCAYNVIKRETDFTDPIEQRPDISCCSRWTNRKSTKHQGYRNKVGI